LLPISKFGLMQITRQRLRPEISISTTEVCPSCKGTGKIGPSLLIADEVEKDFAYLLSQGHRNLRLVCHPMLKAYLREGGFWSSLRWKWFRRHGTYLKLATDSNYHLTEFNFVDTNSEEIIKLN
jgi:ribonuclease G